MYTKNEYNPPTPYSGLTFLREYCNNYNKSAVTLHHKPYYKIKERKSLDPCNGRMRYRHHCQVAT